MLKYSFVLGRSKLTVIVGLLFLIIVNINSTVSAVDDKGDKSAVALSKKISDKDSDQGSRLMQSQVDQITRSINGSIDSDPNNTPTFDMVDFKTKFEGNRKFPEACFQIAHTCYSKGLREGKEVSHKKKTTLFKNAAQAWETVIEDKTISKTKKMSGCYSLADCHRRLGDMKKSNQYLNKVVTGSDDEKLACQALLKMVKNFRDMEDNGISSASPVYLVDPNEIDAYETMGDDSSEVVILNCERDVYRLLVQKYPETLAGKYAAKVLDSENK